MIKALFGGSFDPIHSGHYNVIVETKKQLNVDKVLIIPTGNNPWKESNYICDTHRLKLIDIALGGLEYVEVETIELNGEHKNYTIDTVKYYIEKFPNDIFYYIIGFDQVEKFHMWKNAKEISELVQLVCFDRVGYSNDENIKKYNMICLDIDPVDYSSTSIKAGAIEQLDKKVLQYITNNGLYLELILKKCMSAKRFEHTLSVAKLAKEIAVENDINETSAYIAAMFHDIAKEMPFDEMFKIMNEFYSEYIGLPKVVWHQFVSGYIAKSVYYIDNQEVIDAIYNHTTANLNMSPLSMCVYVSDKYEPLRDFDSTHEIQLCKKDLLLGFKKCLEDTLQYSESKGVNLDKSFYRIYDKYIRGEE